MRAVRWLAVALVLAAALPSASAQLGSANVPGSRPLPSETTFVTGYLTWNSGQGAIKWDPAAPTEDPGGPVDATMGVAGKAQGYAGWVAYSNTGQSTMIPTFSFTSDPVPETIVLNTSLPIRVELQRQKCVALSVELRMDTTFIGGQMFGIPSTRPLKPGTGYCGGIFGTFHLHPEVSTIPAGARLTLKILVHDQNDPIRLGFKDDHRSLILLPTFTPEEMVFRGLNPDGTLTGQDPSPDGSTVLALSPLGLLALPRRRRAGLAVALLLLAAGCAGPSSGPEGGESAPTQTTGGRVNSTVIKGSDVPKGLADNRTGSILGKVHDDLGFPIPRAHALLSGTSHFNDTDDRGQFTLRSVAPGTYRLFLQHQQYKAFEAEVEVAAEQVLRLDIEMELLVPREQNDRPHRHDYWPENGVAERYNGDVATGSPDACTSSITELLPLFFPPGTFTMPSYCEYPFYLKPDATGRSTILPGTREIEVKVSWPSQNVLQRVGVIWYSNLDGFATFMYPRGNGATTRIQIGPEHSDYGHQALTSWRIGLYFWNNGGGQSLGGDSDDGFVIRPAGAALLTPLHAEVRIHKGFVPLEPAHPDFWGPNETRLVWKGELLGACRATCGYPIGWHPQLNDGWKEDGLVPPDTQWLEVLLKRIGAAGTLPNTKWGFLYKPANVPFPTVNGDYTGFRPPPAPKVEGALQRYVIPVKDEETDPFYAKRTNWAITLDDGVDSDDILYYDDARFSIEVIAHRDDPPK